MQNVEDLINAAHKDTLVEHLGIEITLAKEGHVEGTMPVDNRTVQPMRLLHGGASAALIETLGSLGSNMMIDRTNKAAVGLELNINHLGMATNGMVKGIAKVVHAGKRTHVWQIDVYNAGEKHISTGRLTVMVIDK